MAPRSGTGWRRIQLLSRRGFLALAGQALAGVAVASAVRAASALPLYHGPRTERAIALTIDDDWSPARVGAIFDLLVRDGVAATFFPYSFEAALADIVDNSVAAEATRVDIQFRTAPSPWWSIPERPRGTIATTGCDIS